jgi:Uma2 family endonuclease
MEDRTDSQTKENIDEKSFISTRHQDNDPDTFDPNMPRLGQRETEPHSAGITYLHNVLTTNFPKDRTMCDLHHYFKKEGIAIDIQFDISYFKGLQIPHTLSSYYAEKFNNRVPTMAVNILSSSTWCSDLAEKLDYCRLLKIPLYIVFPPYHVASNLYKPPFVRAYILQDDGTYQINELHQVLNVEPERWIFNEIIDVTEIVPFRVGLMKLKQKHQGQEPLY